MILIYAQDRAAGGHSKGEGGEKEAPTSRPWRPRALIVYLESQWLIIKGSVQSMITNFRAGSAVWAVYGVRGQFRELFNGIEAVMVLTSAILK